MHFRAERRLHPRRHYAFDFFVSLAPQFQKILRRTMLSVIMRRKHNAPHTLRIKCGKHFFRDFLVFRAVVDTRQNMRMYIRHESFPLSRTFLFQVERHRRNIVGERSAAEYGKRVSQFADKIFRRNGLHQHAFRSLYAESLPRRIRAFRHAVG